MIQKPFILTALFLGVLTLTGCTSEQNNEGSVSLDDTLSLLTTISHGHGLAVDSADKNKLYIATHQGLLVLKDGKDLYRIGKSQDDFMGFTAHSRKPETFFTSGHSTRGGNLGVQRSDDGGMTWKKLSDGVSGPVDFHSMTLSPANPELLYGWYGVLQRSTDGGESWEQVPSTLKSVISLTAHPREEATVFAATANGLQRSTDKGKTWSPYGEELKEDAVMSVALDIFEPLNMLSYSQSLGLARSTDAGESWQKISQDLGIVLYFAFDPNTRDMVYALNRDNTIFKSIDGGLHWDFVR